VNFIIPQSRAWERFIARERSSLDPFSAALAPLLRQIVHEEVTTALDAVVKRATATQDRMSMTLRQASVATGLSLTRLKDDAAKGRLRTIKKGKARVVTPEDLSAYLGESGN
jgi:hypothetical protein